MSKICIIANPNSGKNTKNPTRLDTIHHFLENNIGKDDVFYFFKAQNLNELEMHITQCHQEKIDILCIDGGDGTIHQIMTMLYKVYNHHSPYPKIAILKGGTMNNIARNVGIPLWLSDHKMLSNILQKTPLEESIHHPLIVDHHLSGFIYGNAGISAFLQSYYDWSPVSAIKGFILMSRAILSALFGTAYAQKLFAGQKMQLEMNNNQYVDHFTILGISSVADLGFYFRPFYSNLHNHQNLHLIAMNCSPLYIAFALPKILFALPTHKSYILDKTGTSISLQFDKPQSFTLDGDLYTSQLRQHIQLGPAVTFLGKPYKP